MEKPDGLAVAVGLAIPTPKLVLGIIDPALPVVWRALEAGTAAVREMFDELREKKYDFDPYYAAHTARFHARHVLATAGHEVKCEPDDLPNSGLCVTYRKINLRIWKSVGGR